MPEQEIRLAAPLGSVVAERYRLEAIIGVGGMGIVVAATHVQLEQQVAIKFLQAEAAASADVVARFMREARAAVRIKSEHVARVLDVGEIDSGAPYMVMERLDGRDLALVLRSTGPLPTETAVDYVLQALDAVAEAHSLGIVHRDLKPANLFLAGGRRGEVVKVLDFGISKMTTATGPGSGMTGTSAVFGTPAYMSPEQLNSARDVDARADIWSLGIILYELLTGNTPFRADTVPQLCVAIMNHRTPPLRAIRPDIPTALEAVIERCLEKDRSRRFSSAEELAIALADFASVRVRASLERIGGKRAVSAVPSDGRNTVTVAPDLRGANSSSRDGSTVSQWGGTSSGLQGSSRRKAAIVAIGVTGLAVAAVVGFSVVRGSGVQPSPTTFDHVAGSSGAQSQETSGLSALVPPASENAALPSTDINEPALAAPSSLRGELSAVSPRSNASEKVSKGAKARTGGASKVAPAASSARTPVPQKGPSDRWEDER